MKTEIKYIFLDWVLGWIYLFQGFVLVTSFGLVKPEWATSFLGWKLLMLLKDYESSLYGINKNVKR